MRTTCCFAEWMPPARMRVLVGVTELRGRQSPRRSTSGLSARQQTITDVSSVRRRRPPAHALQRRDVLHRVPGAAGHDVRLVVLENQDRRLARHAGDHAAVDELVGDEIADDGDAAGREAIDEPKKTIAICGAVA